MTNNGAEIGLATDADLDGILELMAANQPGRGGTLSANLPRARITEMMRDSPVIVARLGGRIAGFLISGSRAASADIPIVRAMLAAYPGGSDAYVYGPICVDEKERGQGLAAAMFAELRRLMPAREGVLFIRRDNTASLRAHARMGMREVAGFVFAGNDVAVLSYLG